MAGYASNAQSLEKGTAAYNGAAGFVRLLREVYNVPEAQNR